MSDFEINKRVAELRYADCIELEVFQNACRGSVADVVSQGVFITSFDFNNPSDAWAIIMIMLDEGATLAINSDGVLSSNFGAKYKGFSFDVDGEPLRAAMIGYLMMQEAQC